MDGNSNDRFKQLCAQAAHEQDPKKLLELTHEINQILEAQEKRKAHQGETRDAA